jgi:alkanesulfonate monooxygenase SsuD/methylene tetrahydromethanopterin reductase-like flavin-dependent oxidoreductase (luciferase family)
MKFGTFNLHAVRDHADPGEVVHEHLAQAVAAERAGFDQIWLAEHNARAYGLCGNVVVAAAAIAMATERVRLATAVTRLPLHNPTRLAEDLCYVDVVSGGRMDLGIGKGYDQLEFGTYDVPFDEREERWAEGYEAVTKILETHEIAFEGQFWNLAPGRLLPPPVNGALPVYLMVSRSHDSMRWAAERLLPVAIGSGPTQREVVDLLDVYRESASAAGHPDAAIEDTLSQTWQLKQMYVAPTAEQAVEEFREGLMWYFDALDNRAMFQFSREQQPYEYFIRHPAVMVGTPDDIGEKLQSYRDATGVHNLICWFNVGGQPHGQVLDALQLFGESVMPSLR